MPACGCRPVVLNAPRRGCWSPRPRPLPGGAADPPSQNTLPMFFGPNGLDTEGIRGRRSGSCLVRPVSGRGPLWGGMARTDGARERGRSRILGGARLGPKGPAAQRWVRSAAGEPLDRGRGCGRRAWLTTTGEVSGDQGSTGEVVQAELVEGCGVIGSPVAAGGVGAAVVPAEREARQWKRCLSGAGGSPFLGGAGSPPVIRSRSDLCAHHRGSLDRRHPGALHIRPRARRVRLPRNRPAYHQHSPGSTGDDCGRSRSDADIGRRPGGSDQSSDTTDCAVESMSGVRHRSWERVMRVNPPAAVAAPPSEGRYKPLSGPAGSPDDQGRMHSAWPGG